MLRPWRPATHISLISTRQSIFNSNARVQGEQYVEFLFRTCKCVRYLEIPLTDILRLAGE